MGAVAVTANISLDEGPTPYFQVLSDALRMVTGAFIPEPSSVTRTPRAEDGFLTPVKSPFSRLARKSMHSLHGTDAQRTEIAGDQIAAVGFSTWTTEHKSKVAL